MSYVRTSGNIEEQATFKHEPDGNLAQPNPVSGTAYTVLNTTRNARIISMCVRVDWTVQPTPLLIIVTIDGQTITHAFTNPVTATYYYAVILGESAETNQLLALASTSTQNKPFTWEGRSVKVEAKTTGGTVQWLYARVKCAKRTG